MPPSSLLVVTSKSLSSPCQLMPSLFQTVFNAKTQRTQRKKPMWGRHSCLPPLERSRPCLIQQGPVRDLECNPLFYLWPRQRLFQVPVCETETMLIVVVIPAQAGIQGPGEPSSFFLDSRLRGNDALNPHGLPSCPSCSSW